MRDKERRANRIDICFFACVLAGFFMLLYFLDLNQARYVGTGVYHSDILAYMKEALGEESGYPFPYRLFFWIIRFFMIFMPVENAMALSVALLNTLSMALVKYYFDIYFDMDLKGRFALLKRISLSLLIVLIFTVSMLINPMKMSLTGSEHYYLGVFTGNPWHNQTYLATRPFAIIAFFTFINIIKNYEYHINVKDFIVFSISLLLTTMTKPSFTLVFVSAAGIDMVYRLILNRFKTLYQTLMLGLCFVPTFIEMIRQYFGVFTTSVPGEERGIAFTFFKVWALDSTNIPRAVLYANFFSFIIFIIFIKDMSDDIPYMFTWHFFIISFLEAAFLAEKGSRFYDFNFSWGYMHGIFFLTLMSAGKLYRAAVRQETERYKIALGAIALVPQAVSGIFYLLRILGGAMYY